MHTITPSSVAYTVKFDEFDCGIMISASHNPFYNNGVKLINGKCEKMDVEVEISFAKREEIEGMVDYVNVRNRYVGYLISLEVYSLRRYKVVLDCVNGAS